MGLGLTSGPGGSGSTGGSDGVVVVPFGWIIEIPSNTVGEL